MGHLFDNLFRNINYKSIIRKIFKKNKSTKKSYY